MDYLAEDQTESFTFDQLRVHLDRPLADTKGLIRLFIEFLLIVVIKKTNKEVYMDVRTFLWNPNRMIELYEMLERMN